MLRYLGCKLPIEFWHLGRYEIDDRMRELTKQIGGDVSCVDALEVARGLEGFRWSSKPGWELKPFCIIHSRFREVLMLDADNVPVRDPEYLFETKEFKATGAIFWPDYLRLQKNRLIWPICEVAYRNEPEFESGQIVVDKLRCWKELQLTMHYNNHSDFYYRHIWGDKETYHMAWRRLNTKYSMTRYPIHRLPANGVGGGGSLVMCQHDFDGNIVFQHRNLAKWDLNPASNRRIDGFKHEQRCLQFIKELSKLWNGLLDVIKPRTNAEKQAFNELVANEIYMYDRQGKGQRHISFAPNQTIARGRARLEQSWEVTENINGEVILTISGDGQRTMELRRREDGVWLGGWLVFEKSKVTLTPTSKVKDDVLQKTMARLLRERYIYRRINHDKRLMELGADGTIVNGRGTNEQHWELRLSGRMPQLVIYGADNVMCVLEEKTDGVWHGQWTTRDKLKIDLIPIPNA
jgi:hypothetical protein